MVPLEKQKQKNNLRLQVVKKLGNIPSKDELDRLLRKEGALERYIGEYRSRPSCRDMQGDEYHIAMDIKILACYNRVCEYYGVEPRGARVIE